MPEPFSFRLRLLLLGLVALPDPSLYPRRCRLDPVCQFTVTQREALEPAAGRGMAAGGGSVKSRHLGQFCLDAESPDRCFLQGDRHAKP